MRRFAANMYLQCPVHTLVPISYLTNKKEHSIDSIHDIDLPGKCGAARTVITRACLKFTTGTRCTFCQNEISCNLQFLWNPYKMKCLKIGFSYVYLVKRCICVRSRFFGHRSFTSSRIWLQNEITRKRFPFMFEVFREWICRWTRDHKKSRPLSLARCKPIRKWLFNLSVRVAEVLQINWFFWKAKSWQTGSFNLVYSMQEDTARVYELILEPVLGRKSMRKIILNWVSIVSRRQSVSFAQNATFIKSSWKENSIANGFIETASSSSVRKEILSREGSTSSTWVTYRSVSV